MHNEDYSKEFEEVVSLFERTLTKFCQIDKKPIAVAPGIVLHHAEMHAIGAIGNNPEINLTALAEEIGVTKSAASKTITKLIKKK